MTEQNTADIKSKKEKKAKNKKRNLIIRIVISILLLIFFVYKVDIAKTFEFILDTNYYLILLCVVIYLIGQSISAYKWSIISNAIGFNKRFIEYIQYYYIGMFFNLFLPSTIGGDVGKAYYLSKGDTAGRKAPAIYTVLAERFSGLTVLVWLGTIAMMTSIGQSIPFTVKLLFIGLSLSIIIGAPLMPFFMKIVFSEKNWLNRSMMNDILVFWDRKIVFQCLGWSLIFHSLIIGIHMIISLAMNLEVNILYYCAIYPIVAIIGFIPVAFNGIGVREGAYIYFLGLVNLPESAGLAFGLIWFAIVVIASLIGGIVYVKGHHSPPPKEYEPEGINLDEITHHDIDEKETEKELTTINK